MWCLTLNEFDNKILRKIYHLKERSISSEWRPSLKSELCAPNDTISVVYSRRLRWVGYVARIERICDTKRCVLVGRPSWK